MWRSPAYDFLNGCDVEKGSITNPEGLHMLVKWKLIPASVLIKLIKLHKKSLAQKKKVNCFT